MGVPIVFGTKVQGHWIGDKTTFCGACLEKTEHAILALHARDHVYFVPYGKGVDVGRALRCETCQTVVPEVKRTGRSKDERMVDAFLDAHVLPLERADKSVWVGFAGAGIATFMIALFVGYWQVADGLDLSSWAYWAGAGVSVAATVGAYLFVQRAIGNQLIGRAARARIAKLQTLTSWTLTQVTERAGERRLKRLTAFLEAHDGRS